MGQEIVRTQRWQQLERYGIWVSDLGAVTNSLGADLVPHMVNGDLRVSCYYGGETRSFSLKRLVAESFIPKPFVGNTGLIDFINGDHSDVRAENLVWRRREQKDRGEHKEPGVSFNKETTRWKAYAIINRANYHIGYYATKESAIAARDKAYTMIAEGVPIEKIRAALHEAVPVLLEYIPRAPRAPKTKSEVKARVAKLKDSWKDWPETKKMIAAMDD